MIVVNWINEYNALRDSVSGPTTEQAMADVAYFAKNIKFPGIDRDLTAPNTPYILYGGSYAGGLVAFLRVTYPDLFWGAISSSGVTVAIWDYWQYYSIHAEFGPPKCVSTTQKLTNVVDNIIFKHPVIHLTK